MSVRPFHTVVTGVDDFAGVVATAQYESTSSSVAVGNATTHLAPRFVPHYYDPNAPVDTPLFGKGVVVTHILPELHEAGVSVTVDEALLQAIWAGNVTEWNDTAIQQLNPTLTAHLPYQRITMAYFEHWPRPTSPDRMAIFFFAYGRGIYGQLPRELDELGGVLLGINKPRRTPWKPSFQDIASEPEPGTNTRTASASAKGSRSELQGGSQVEPELEQGSWGWLSLLLVMLALPLLQFLMLSALRRLRDLFEKPWSWEIDGSEIHFGDLLCNEGAHGEVIRAVWQDREVAVKVLRHAKNPPRRIVKTFREEVSALASVRHPRVVGVLAASTASPRSFYIVLDYMADGSLFDVIHNDRLNFSPKGRVRMALDTARGMHHLHSLGITHSNLSSHNVLAAEDGFRVSGFGLTRVKSYLRDSGQARRDDNSEWLAPELRDNARYPPRARQADIYSFGVVMWEILTRLDPSPELGGRVVQDLDLPLPKSLPQVPVGYTALMRLCCEHHPIDRPSFSFIKSRLEDLYRS